MAKVVPEAPIYPVRKNAPLLSSPADGGIRVLNNSGGVKCCARISNGIYPPGRRQIVIYQNEISEKRFSHEVIGLVRSAGLTTGPESDLWDYIHLSRACPVLDTGSGAIPKTVVRILQRSQNRRLTQIR